MRLQDFQQKDNWYNATFRNKKDTQRKNTRCWVSFLFSVIFAEYRVFSAMLSTIILSAIFYRYVVCLYAQ